MLHEHGVPDKHTLHTDALRIPLLVRWPDVIRACDARNCLPVCDRAKDLLLPAIRPSLSLYR